MHKENVDEKGNQTPLLLRAEKIGLSLINEFSNVPALRSWDAHDVKLGVQQLLRPLRARAVAIVVNEPPVVAQPLELELELEDGADTDHNDDENDDLEDAKDHDLMQLVQSPLENLVTLHAKPRHPLAAMAEHIESYLNPQERFIFVEPPRYGSRLAPPGTELDLSAVEPYVKLYPLCDDNSLSLEEQKLAAIWDYELGRSHEPQEEDDDVQQSSSFWYRLFKRGQFSVEAQYAKNHPWYRVMKLTEQTKTSDPQLFLSSHTNMDMFPRNHHNYNESQENRQVVSYVPNY
jgi:hypothetical protein